jgi:tRNA (cmo5U34)-methyltransferase
VSVRKVFDKSANTYDTDRRQLIPCYDDFYSITLDIIPFGHDRALRVLDLGAGTGALAGMVASKYQKAQLSLIDISPAMLQVAEKNFTKEDLARISFRVMDYVQDDFKGTYDLVVSSLSIHHLSDSDKKKLFDKVCKTLEPGGLFINADQVLGENEVAENIFTRTWLRQVRERGVTDDTLQTVLERMKEDKMSPLSSQLSWLKQAGFIDVTTWYQHYNFVVFSGMKPLSPAKP